MNGYIIYNTPAHGFVLYLCTCSSKWGCVSKGPGLEDLVVQSQPGCVLLQAEALLVNHLHPLFGTLHVQLSVSQIQRRYTNLAANGPAVVQQSEVVLKSVIFEGIRRQSKHHG